MDVAAALRKHQAWLSAIGGFMWGLDFKRSSFDRLGMEPDWGELSLELRRLTSSDDALDWMLVLEEYEILLPQTREVRLQLIDRSRVINQQLNDLHTALLDRTLVPPVTRFMKLKELAGDPDKHGSLAFMRDDQHALLEYLRVHIQNLTLSDIAGRRVPVPAPVVTTVANIVVGRDGMLSIKDGEPATAIQKPAAPPRSSD
jgi:hypothetical protein